MAIEKHTQPPTDLENTIVTGSGNDPYTALDRFGRVTRLFWQQGSNDRLNTVCTPRRIQTPMRQIEKIDNVKVCSSRRTAMK